MLTPLEFRNHPRWRSAGYEIAVYAAIALAYHAALEQAAGESVIAIAAALTLCLLVGAFALNAVRRRLVKMWGPLTPEASSLALGYGLAALFAALGEGFSRQATGWASALLVVAFVVALAVRATRSRVWLAYVAILVGASVAASIPLIGIEAGSSGAPAQVVAVAVRTVTLLGVALGLAGNERLMWPRDPDPASV